jgi:F0F1-type ATP synthase membrane subunit b/b'
VFVVVSLVIGSRAVFAMIVAAALSFVLLTFVFYVKPIEKMLRHRFAS